MAALQSSLLSPHLAFPLSLTMEWEPIVASCCNRAMDMCINTVTVDEDAADIESLSRWLYDEHTGYPYGNVINSLSKNNNNNNNSDDDDDARSKISPTLNDISCASRRSASVRIALGRDRNAIRRISVLMRWLADNYDTNSYSFDKEDRANISSNSVRDVEVLNTLRIIRNVAAAIDTDNNENSSSTAHDKDELRCPSIEDNFIKSGVLAVLLDLALEKRAWDHNENDKSMNSNASFNIISIVSLQALANICLGSSAAKQRIWHLAFPDKCLQIIYNNINENNNNFSKSSRWISPLLTIIYSVVADSKSEATRFILGDKRFNDNNVNNNSNSIESFAGCFICSIAIQAIENDNQV